MGAVCYGLNILYDLADPCPSIFLAQHGKFSCFCLRDAVKDLFYSLSRYCYSRYNRNSEHAFKFYNVYINSLVTGFINHIERYYYGKAPFKDLKGKVEISLKSSCIYDYNGAFCSFINYSTGNFFSFICGVKSVSSWNVNKPVG